MLRTGIILTVLASPLGAQAQDLQQRPKFVEGEETVVNTMMCDTVEQIETILRAQTEQGIRAGQAAYLRLRSTPNELREPTCLVAPYRLKMLDVATVWENLPTTDGSTTTVYILYVLANGRPYAILSPVPIEAPGYDV
ncbi:MAG: hypothetical protein ACFCVH_05310 [Alphaproteobacteria bacterium]